MTSKLFAQLIKRKSSAVILLLVIAGGGYFVYAKISSNDGVVRYATAQVQKGTLIVSTTGSGQVSASNQVDIKPKVSGEITALYAMLGQEVDEGEILATIDARDAERAVRDAGTSLETAKLELEKMLEPLDALTLLQAENSLAQAKESKQKSEDDLKKAYEDGFNSVASAFLELPDIMTGLYDMLFSNTLGGGGQWNVDYYADAVKAYDEKSLQYKEETRTAYQRARAAYDKNSVDYKSASRFSDYDAIESLVSETYNAAKDIAEAVRNATNLIQFYKSKLTEHGLRTSALVDTHLSTLSTDTGETNSTLSNLLSIKRTIQDSKDAIVSAEHSIEEKGLSLAKTKKGPEDLDIRAKKVAIQQKEDALITARQTLADHYVRSLFSGVIAKVSVEKGSTVSAGTAIATLVAKQKIAEVSLNEIDVAKVKIGQKATLTFDAIPDLTITGQVAEVDAVGTISQGVVTYTVKIAFDAQDDRVKTAMSASAAIVNEAKPNVLLAPNSAVKSQGGMSYVEVVEGDDRNSALAVPLRQGFEGQANSNGIILKGSPRRQPVEIGAANDELTEITSGLKEGELVVSRTIQPTSSQTTQTQQQSGGLRIPGLPGGGGGRFR